MFDDGDVMILSAPAGAEQGPVAPAADGRREASAADGPERCAEGEAVERLASMPPGAMLADVIERLMSQLLCPAASPEPGSAPASDGGAQGRDGDTLLGPVVDPGEQALLRAAGAASLEVEGAQASGALGAEVLAGLGAQALSELVAACGRLASWASWAQALASACLSRAPELRMGPAPKGPYETLPRFVTAQENQFNTTSEMACRLGVSRTRANRILQRGQALLSGGLQPTEALHRVGLIDEAKTSLIATRLEGTPEEVAQAVQDTVLPRAAHRTHAQLARDLDRALTAHDPQGASLRRQRNTAQRHVTRPRPAGQGVHEMRMLMPSMDAFLLDATLDAVAASARTNGDERTTCQLRADALVAMSLATLRQSHNQAAAHQPPTPAGTPMGAPPGCADTAPPPVAPLAAQEAGPAAEQRPRRQDLIGQTIGQTIGQITEQDPGTQETPAHQRRLMPDGVPLEGLLTALSDLVGSHSPWWMPSDAGPVPLPPGLSVNIDVTVPLDQLIGDGDPRLIGDGGFSAGADEPPPHRISPVPAGSATSAASGASAGTADHPAPLSSTGGRSLLAAHGEDLHTTNSTPLPSAECGSPPIITGDNPPIPDGKDLPAAHGGDLPITYLPITVSARSTTSAASFSPSSPTSLPASPALVAAAAAPALPAAPHVSVGRASGPVPLVVARALAAGGTWRRLVTDPASGAVIDVGRRRYRPPAGLRDLVTARDRSCTHPGCEIPAHRCDLDHITPWAQGGTTSLDNLTSLRQSHHLLKHTPGWSLTRTPDGALTWRTPTGARYRRDHNGTITMLPRRIGAHSAIQAATRLPQALADAITDAVLTRLELALTQAAPNAQTGHTPVLQTRGPRSGRPGDYEAHPYPEELHTLGITALLDEAIPF